MKGQITWIVGNMHVGTQLPRRCPRHLPPLSQSGPAAATSASWPLSGHSRPIGTTVTSFGSSACEGATMKISELVALANKWSGSPCTLDGVPGQDQRAPRCHGDDLDGAPRHQLGVA